MTKKQKTGALKDFDRPAKPASAVKKEDVSSASTLAVTEAADDGLTVEEVWSEDFIKQAADQFQRNFEDLLQNGN